MGLEYFLAMWPLPGGSIWIERSWIPPVEGVIKKSPKTWHYYCLFE
jgi:hypothetical protein